jgi:hypothetical protein
MTESVVSRLAILGDIIAVVLSYSVNHHIGWAILHGLFGWFYVIYYALGYGR